MKRSTLERMLHVLYLPTCIGLVQDLVAAVRRVDADGIKVDAEQNLGDRLVRD